MPDSYLHKRFAFEAVHTFDKTLDFNALKLGAIGPDCYLYLIFHQRQYDAKRLSDLLHDEAHMPTFLTHLINYVKKHYDLELYAYLIGFISHIILDITVNPFIEARTQTEDERLIMIKQIDSIFLKRDFALPAHKVDIMHEIFPCRQVPYPVQAMLETVMREAFSQSHAGYIYKKSYTHMRRTFKVIIRDRFKVKTAVYHGIEKLFKPKRRFSLLTYVNPINLGVLNDTCDKWQSPKTQIAQYDSVDMLYQMACLKYETIIQDLDSYLYHDVPLNFNDFFETMKRQPQ